jgi:uncharacterized protein
VSKIKAKRYSREELFQLCFFGLYPEPFLEREDTLKYRLWQENYFRSYIERDIRALFPQLNTEAYRRFIKMLGVASGDLFKASSFSNSLDVSQPTVKNYLEIAEGTFLIRRLNCYSKNTKKRLVKMPKAYIKDPVITNYLLNINNIDDLRSHPSFGNLGESFIIEQIIKNLEVLFIPNVVKTRELAPGGLNGMTIKVLPVIFEENDEFDLKNSVACSRVS